MKVEKHKIWCQNDVKKYPYRNQNDDIMTTMQKLGEKAEQEADGPGDALPGEKSLMID